MLYIKVIFEFSWILVCVRRYKIARSGSRTTADFKGFLHLLNSKYGELAFLLSYFSLEKKPDLLMK